MNNGEYKDLGGGRLEINPREALTRRMPPSAPTQQSLDQLRHELAISAVIYEQHGDGGREGVGQSLRNVVDYLRSQGFPVHALLPLVELEGSLKQLDRRIVTPLLAPRRGPGKPPKSDVALRTEAFIAIVMECCVRHLRDSEQQASYLKEAAKLTEKLINKSALGLRITARQAEKAREAISEEANTDYRRSLFDRFIDDANVDAAPLKWARSFIATGWVPAAKVS